MRSGSLLAAVLAAGCLLAVACDDGEDAGTDELDLVSSGTLTVCTDVPYPPFGFEDQEADLGYSGFDIELIAAIADALDLEVEVVATHFELLASGDAMADGTCDLAASAMVITEQRAEQVDFSEPYYDAAQALLVADGATISGIDDLTEGVVGVQADTPSEEYAEDHVPGAEVRSFDSTGDLLVGLETGQIDAILQAKRSSVEYAREHGLEVVAEYETGEAYGFAVTRDRQDGLLAAINEALEVVRDDGTYEAIYDAYFATE